MDTLVPYPTLFRSWFGGATAQSAGGLLDADRYVDFVEGVEGLEAIAIEREPILLGEADLPAGHVDPGEDIEVERSPSIGIPAHGDRDVGNTPGLETAPPSPGASWGLLSTCDDSGKRENAVTSERKYLRAAHTYKY